MDSKLNDYDNFIYNKCIKAEIDILGTTYKINCRRPRDDAKLESMLGYTDTSTKEIVIAVLDKDEVSVSDLYYIGRNILRHECIHAFLYESGLDECSWADNEELVDWIAKQFPKLLDSFTKLGIER